MKSSVPARTVITRLLCFALAAFALTSCEDKELVKKNEELRLQLSELEKKVDLMEINAGEDPGDQTAALNKTNSELRKAMAELEALDNEKDELEKKHAKMEEELRKYQKEYRIQ
ncbi:hypothetical protein NT6N_08380 [Oceaniferula spumae]|uniref:Uncharacterized protein n=1 Tax=Oceaniferula spumae TaxID=2979115 RepID=A0AAT9FIG7_9BACT